MIRPAPILHLVCGKPAAGKSTLTARLGAADDTLVISEDSWLAALYGAQMQTLQDYLRWSAALRQAMTPHVTALLRARVSVVLDFPANTVETRGWMRALAEAAGVPARLHLLEVPDAVCKARLRARNAAGDHPFTLSEDQFDRLAAHFVPPAAEEGFEIVHHDG